MTLVTRGLAAFADAIVVSGRRPPVKSLKVCSAPHYRSINARVRRVCATGHSLCEYVLSV